MSNRIFVEGIDGSGKSVLAAKLVGHAGHIIEAPPMPFRMSRNVISESAAPYARFCYFLAGNLQTAEIVRSHPAGERVVVVRHVWSTVAYFAALEGQGVSSVWSLVSPFLGLLEVPAKIVYLTTSRAEQVRRLSERRSETTLQRSLAASSQVQHSIMEAYEEVFALTSAAVLRFDTSVLAPEELARSVESALYTGSGDRE
jgi:thymidylate kinase